MPSILGCMQPSEKCLVMPEAARDARSAGFKFPLQRRSHGAAAVLWAVGGFFQYAWQVGIFAVLES